MSGLTLIRDDGVTTVRFESPILSRPLLAELGATIDALADIDSRTPLVLASVHPTIFLAGADLGEIAGLDPHSCVGYARLGRSVAGRLAAYPAPVVSAVAGSCSGGGFDLVMSSDAIVASPEASFGHPGVRRGLVTGWGGTATLPSRLGSATAREAFLTAGKLTADEMREPGLVRVVHGDLLPAARRTARRLSRLEAARFRAWRQLRGPGLIDRFRVFVVEKS